MRLSYLSSFLVVVIGVLIGWYVTSVNSVVIWIVSGLWGGYTASNVLKWYWWRFNGYGYFWGMVTGITSALAVPGIMSRIPSLQNWATLHSLNLDVSHRIRAGVRRRHDRLPARHVPHPARGGRSSDGLLSPRAAVGFLGPDSRPR